VALADELAREVADALGEPIESASAVAGGSINDAWKLGLRSGRRAFLKARSGAEPAEFRAEAAGLRWLAEAGAASVPAVLAEGTSRGWLALQWIEAGPLSVAGAEELGRALAALHRSGADAHGALPPGTPDDALRIGSVRLPATSGATWAEVYAEHRLRPLLAMARESGAIGEREAGAVEAVCGRIGELAGPEEPPSRLHGDLWGGNVLADAAGNGWLIDPAAHGGHREVDLAMLRLFGGPGERMFAAYGEAHPLADGHAERVELWQILPLLVHAVLFGGSYGAAAGRAASRYA
jgi:fructosamine-3-kinase